jgi:predicted type IV restriction endonuclease
MDPFGRGSMLNNMPAQILEELQALDFAGKGEAFVEQKFLTPLLACLGYETHKDYEVIRHGDDGAAFKLQYPPVEHGAVRVKHYNPDYVPTIRKKMFWVIEAKNPNVSYPFDTKYLVQGLQYCIHPEIQASYLLVTNGVNSAVFDAHGSVFFEKDIYQPILEFTSSQLISRWDQIFALLSVETIRARIEANIKAMYDKLCQSSLDKTYPARLAAMIGASARDNANKIERHVISLYVEGMNRDTAEWRKDMERLNAMQVLQLMELPLRGGETEASIFVDKCIADQMAQSEIFDLLIRDFDQQTIFRKEQSFLGVCCLYQRATDDAIKQSCISFCNSHANAELPLLNQVECALLRVYRKVVVISFYPEIRKRIAAELQSAPELIRFVRPPNALSMTYPLELSVHAQLYPQIKALSEEHQRNWLADLAKTEAGINDAFAAARAKLSSHEQQVGGFEYYGVGGKHYSFNNIAQNYGVIAPDRGAVPPAETPKG